MSLPSVTLLLTTPQPESEGFENPSDNFFQFEVSGANTVRLLGRHSHSIELASKTSPSITNFCAGDAVTLIRFVRKHRRSSR